MCACPNDNWTYDIQVRGGTQAADKELAKGITSVRTEAITVNERPTEKLEEGKKGEEHSI